MEAKRPFSDDDWLSTPESVRRAYRQLELRVADLTRGIEQLEVRLGTNSSNSDKPPSSDSPFTKPRKQSGLPKGKRGARKGHKGYRQRLLEPTRTVALRPLACGCGNRHLAAKHTVPFYTHQVIELPEIRMQVTHYVLHKCQCPRCGKTVKAPLPFEYRTGFGPRLCALIAQLSGIHALSREAVQDFCHSVLQIPISIGATQNVIDRSSQAIECVYEAIGTKVRSAAVNHVDETSWYNQFKPAWLWVMVNTTAAYFMVHTRRSKQAFLELIGDWEGILISDNYRLYRNWIHLRQTCLAHYLRRAKALAQRNDGAVSRFGERLLTELGLLCNWAHAPPNVGQWRAFYARFIHLVFSHHDRQDDAGVFARLLIQEMDCLWLFLEQNGVEHTNNRAERAMRTGVLWRKRSKGTQSEKGNRWVERVLSLRETCRQRKLKPFPILVDAISAYFKEQQPDLSWLETPRAN